MSGVSSSTAAVANQGNDFRNIQVHSNTFLYLGDSQKPIQLYGAAGLTMDDVRIYNNIFYQCGGTGGGYAYDIDSRFTNVRATTTASTTSARCAGQDAHSITANPQFVNYTQASATFDVHLQAASPCINRAVALGRLVTLPSRFVDMDGKVRPSGGATTWEPTSSRSDWQAGSRAGPCKQTRTPRSIRSTGAFPFCATSLADVGAILVTRQPSRGSGCGRSRDR